MFQRILVSLDGSSRDEHALAMASHLARTTHGSLVLVRVVSTATEFWPALVAQTTLVGTIVRAHLQEAREYLTRVALSSILDEIPTETIVRFGPVIPTLLSIIRVYETDALIMCRHKSIDPRYIMQESITARLANRTPVPTIVLNEADTSDVYYHPDTHRAYSALVTLAGSTSTGSEQNTLQTVAPLLASLSFPKQGQLHFMTVVNPENSEQRDQQNVENAIQLAAQHEKEMIAYIQKSWMETLHPEPCVEMTSSVILGNNVTKAVAEMATQRDDKGGTDQNKDKPHADKYDFIVLSAHVYKESTQFVQDDTIEHLLQSTQRPLVITPAQEAVHHAHEQKVQTQKISV
jgi:nucleotide-binding universal stress UspA family protein